MKKITLILAFTAFTLIAIAQQAEFGKIIGNDTYSTYVSKTGDIISIGDTLILGKPSGEFGFVFITQGDQRVVSSLAGKKVVITQLKSYGTKKSGYTLFAQFKGYGLLPVFINYENAIEAFEVINPKAKLTRAQAIDKLKEAKELLDLQLMTNDEYEALKKDLTPIIIPSK
jgi:hypothetical protein